MYSSGTWNWEGRFDDGVDIMRESRPFSLRGRVIAWLFLVSPVPFFSPPISLGVKLTVYPFLPGSADTTINLWDTRAANAHKPIQTLPEASDTVSSLHAHMPSYSLASCSYDGRVRVYDLRMGRTSVDVVAHPVTSVRCSTDGNALLASTLDGRIRMLDRADGKLLQGFGGNPSTSTSGGGGNDGEGPVYRNEELRIRSVLAKGDAVVLSGSEAEKKGDRSSQAFVFAWDVLSGEFVAAVPAGEGVRAVSCVAWNEKRGQWAGGCSDGMVSFCPLVWFAWVLIKTAGSVKVYG